LKTKVLVFFNARDRPWPVVRRILVAGGLMGDAKKGPSASPTYRAWFSDGSKELQAFRDAIADEGLTRSERREYVFTKAELDAAQLLSLTVNRAPLLGGGVEDGTQYDFSTGCNHCGTGSVQTSPLLVQKSAVRQTTGIRNTVFGDVVMSTRLADALVAAGVQGIRLGEVHSGRTGEALALRQLYATAELPPWSRHTKGGEVGDKQCRVCRRDGYFDSMKNPLLVAYETSEVELEAFPDLMRTWEHFDYSWTTEERLREVGYPPDKALCVRLASPGLICKQELRALFARYRVPGLRFKPVAFVQGDR
jgi:hypothetical protein